MTENTEIIQEKVVQNDEYEPNLFDRIVINIGNIVAILYILAVFITVYEVFMRYALGIPTQWVLEISVLFIGTAMLYGGCYCMANNGHIRVTIIRDMMPKILQKINDVIVAIFTFLFTLSLSYAAIPMVKKAFFKPNGDLWLEKSGSAFNSAMPALIKLFLLICVFLMMVQAFVQMISIIVKTFKKEEK